MINKVFLIGRIGKIKEIPTRTGTLIVDISVATYDNIKNDQGQWDEITTWHKVRCFGKNAESVKNRAVVGAEIFIEGKIQYDSYERQDGSKVYSTTIVCLSSRMLNSARSVAQHRPIVNENVKEEPAERKPMSIREKLAAQAAGKPIDVPEYPEYPAPPDDFPFD